MEYVIIWWPMIVRQPLVKASLFHIITKLVIFYLLHVCLTTHSVHVITSKLLNCFHFLLERCKCCLFKQLLGVSYCFHPMISGAHINITSAMSCIFVFSKLMPFCISIQKTKLLEEIKEHKVLAQLKFCFSNRIISSVVHVYSCIFPYLTSRGRLFCSKI
jgi:hypothetical protein